MSGDAEVNNMAPIVTKNDEGEKYSKCCGGDGKEVDRDDVLDVVVEERPPRLRGRLAWVNSVLVDGGLGDNMAQQREFGLNAWCPPQRILTRHAADQVADLGFDLRSAGSRPRLPSPEELEALAMPADHGVGLHDQQSGAPICPNSGQQRPEDSIPLTQPWCS